MNKINFNLKETSHKENISYNAIIKYLSTQFKTTLSFLAHCVKSCKNIFLFSLQCLKISLFKQ